MNRTQLEHVIRAAGAIAETDTLIVIGSQAILASCPDAPVELVTSREVDLYPAEDPSKADLIDGSIGEGSLFDEQFSYYAHGVGPETAKLPAGWRGRAVTLRTPQTRGVTALCLHPLDIAVSKLLAGRDKDMQYLACLLRHGLVTAPAVRGLFPELENMAWRALAEERLRQCMSAAEKAG